VAVVALDRRDLGIALAAQLLVYPATDLSALRDPEAIGKYLGENFAEKARDPRASPALASRHAGLAPAILGFGVYDFLHQDNVAYAALVRAAGVPLTVREFPTLNHGFLQRNRGLRGLARGRRSALRGFARVAARLIGAAPRLSSFLHSSVVGSGQRRLVMADDVSHLDNLRAAYRAAVEEWIAAIRQEEALALVDHEIADVDSWEEAHFAEDAIRTKVLAAKRGYEDALREKFFNF
jgi:hypothetical protein